MHWLPTPNREAAAVGFVLRLGRALHGYGLSADALEHALQAMSDRLGLEANFFTTPTSIFAAFGPPERQHTHLIRVYPGDVDLGKLARLDAVSRDVEQGRLSVDRGLARASTTIIALPPISRPVVRVLGYGVASAVVCRILGGGLNEVLVAGFAGLLTGVISLASKRLPHGTHVFELVAAFAVSLVVTCFAAISDLRLSIPTATLGGVIVLAARPHGHGRDDRTRPPTPGGRHRPPQRRVPRVRRHRLRCGRRRRGRRAPWSARCGRCSRGGCRTGR